jgi:hypothetical protein
MRGQLDRFTGFALEEDARHPIVEHMREIDNHLLCSILVALN